MKTLYLIGGTMGVGKTTVCQRLKKVLPNAVFLDGLDTADCRVVRVSLTVDADNLKHRLRKDVEKGIRTADVIERSVARLGLYERLDTVKIDTSGRSVGEIADDIMALGGKADWDE